MKINKEWKKKSFSIVVCICICLSLVTGCKKETKKEEKGTFVCYVNTEGTDLIKEEYEIRGDSAKKAVKDLLNAMQNVPESIEYKSVFPANVKIKNWSLTDEKLNLYFNTSYQEMKSEEELLLRAAVVQTMVQIPEVKKVGFWIEEQELKDNLGNSIGYMRAEDFVQNTGSSIHSYSLGKIALYFPNEKSDKLIRQEVSVRYNSNMSIEKLIIEQLIKGPSSQNMKAVIPPETKVLGVSIKDGICYVNLDAGFLDTSYVENPKLTIYSIVNSMVAGGNASMVQISVNGETDIQYMDSVDLSRPLTADWTLTEENEE